jgi:hypothetical protein
MRTAFDIRTLRVERRCNYKVLFRGIFLFALCVPAAFSQKLVIELQTQEGQLLQTIDAEQNAEIKVALLEDFAKRFPNHEAATWVLSHLQSHHLSVKEFDRVFEYGTRILSLDPTELSAAHNCLKAAEGKKDVGLIKLWSRQASQLARRNLQEKRPEFGDEEQVAEWKQKIDYARQVDQYTEYSLYFASLQSKDPVTKSGLIEALEQRNPTSEYLAQMRTAHTTVVRQVDIEEAVAAAEQQFSKGEYNEDLLLMAATHLMQKRRDPDKVIVYSLKLIEMLSTTSKPSEISDAEWELKKQSMLGNSHWMIGLLSSTQNKFSVADKHLRAALPLLTNEDMLAGAYYHLGYVNYQMAEAGERIRIHDAVRFTKECININSAVQQQATENLKAMKAEYGLQD